MNVKIRKLVENDAFTSYVWRNDKEVFMWTGNTYKNEISLETEIDWIKKVIANRNEYRCAIIVDEQYVGNIYLTNITDTVATYHIFIGDKNYWGKGVAYKASQLILDYAFNHLFLKIVELRVRKENTRAITLYNKLGFTKVDETNEFILMKITYEQFKNISGN